ncbi:hypothetical protein [Lusitaniella coriacea]|uniref:hypothetical protein n=1 Tax=Lusitaniella coriacea TaxID=1983105 RepID=UPI003CF5E64A
MKFPSIKSQLQQQVSAAMLVLKQTQTSNETIRELIEPDRIRLYQIGNFTAVCYRCAIALGLARHYRLSAMEIACQLRDAIAAQSVEFQFAVRVEASGWMEFHLRDRAIALWLEQLFAQHQTEQFDSGEKQEISANLFPIQYAHSRCCSLLRLANREGAILLDRPQEYSPPWIWLDPISIPWLKGEDTLRFEQAVEWQPISRFLAIADAIASETKTSPTQWLKLATDLSNAILEFERSCRIFGDVRRKNPELAQVRLGLVAIAQFLLGWLLQQKLGIAAPVEL